MSQGLDYPQPNSPQRWLLLAGISCGLHLMALLALGARLQWLTAPGTPQAEPTPVELIDLADLPPQAGLETDAETAADVEVDADPNSELEPDAIASDTPPLPQEPPTEQPDSPRRSTQPESGRGSRATPPTETRPSARDRSSASPRETPAAPAPARDPRDNNDSVNDSANDNGDAIAPALTPDPVPDPVPADPVPPSTNAAPPATAPAPGDGAVADPPTGSGPTGSGPETDRPPETLNARFGGIRVSPTGRDIPDQLPQLQTESTPLISWPLAATSCDLSARDRLPNRARLALRIVVDDDGTLLGVSAEESSGDARVDRLVECLVMARPPRLTPAISGGQPIISDAALLEVELSLP